jgi:hypothetical protein
MCSDGRHRADSPDVDRWAAGITLAENPSRRGVPASGGGGSAK